MKGFPTEYGYHGYIPSSNRYMLFDTEEEYLLYYLENEI